MLPDTSCSFGIHVDCIITIYLWHGRLVSLYNQQQTGNKLLPTQETCWRRQDTCCQQLVAGQHVSWCKRGLMHYTQYWLMARAGVKIEIGPTQRWAWYVHCCAAVFALTISLSTVYFVFQKSAGTLFSLYLHRTLTDFPNPLTVHFTSVGLVIQQYYDSQALILMYKWSMQIMAHVHCNIFFCITLLYVNNRIADCGVGFDRAVLYGLELDQGLVTTLHDTGYMTAASAVTVT